MPTLRTILRDPAEIDRRSRPRDDVMVQERRTETSADEAGPGVDAAGVVVFAADAGPFAVWERRIEPTGDGTATETVRYAIDAPYWGRLVDQFLRGAARRGIRPGTSPWWSPSDRLTRRDATVMGLCATLALAGGFIGALLAPTIPAITNDLNSGSGTAANILAISRIGAVLTFAAMALADRRGRRPIIGACIVGSVLACLVTAAAPNVATVTVSQLVTRGLIAAVAFLIPIVCAEELPAGSRAYGIGLMALPGGLGAGMVLWFLPVLDLGDAAWRVLFVLPLLPMTLALLALRRLPESRRFERDKHIPDEIRHQHIRVSRLIVLGVSAVLLNLFVAPTQQLQSDYLSNTRSMSFTSIAAFLLLTNTWGFIGIVGGARLADRGSRRLTASIGVVGLAVGNTLMFQVAGAPMWAASLLGSVVGGAVIPSMGAMLPELFPTLRRGAANGLLNIAGVVGSAAGLLIVGGLVEEQGYGPIIAALGTAPLVVAGLVWLLPETAGVELEALNPDD